MIIIDELHVDQNENLARLSYVARVKKQNNTLIFLPDKDSKNWYLL